MSLDIDWSLLSSQSTSSDSDTPGTDPEILLTTSLIESLNKTLSTAKLPSWIGPISITGFEFGNAGPSVEITDIRDVWRAFDEGDDEGDDEVAENEGHGHGHYDQEGRYHPHLDRRGSSEGYDGYGYRQLNAKRRYRKTTRSNTMTSGETMESKYDMVSPLETDFGIMEQDQGLPEEYDHPDDVSVYSGFSPRHSVAAVGIGLGSTSGVRTPLTPGLGGGSSLWSAPLSGRLPSSYSLGQGLSRIAEMGHPPSLQRHHHHHQSTQLPRSTSLHHQYPSTATDILSYGHVPLHAQSQLPRSRSYNRGTSRHTSQQRLPRHSPTPISSPPESPPARPIGLSLPPGHRPNPAANGHDPQNSISENKGIPSLQLHLHLDHTSDLHLTILTSLQVNYPSSMFMSLPLKLSITGLSLSADMILAYNGSKHRVHICIVDNDPDNKEPVGQRLLPDLHIESEIGHSDAHVLRNVGKVERFIADAVRKTLVDELVFPNFHTIAL